MRGEEPPTLVPGLPTPYSRWKPARISGGDRARVSRAGTGPDPDHRSSIPPGVSPKNDVFLFADGKNTHGGQLFSRRLALLYSFAYNLTSSSICFGFFQGVHCTCGVNKLILIHLGCEDRLTAKAGSLLRRRRWRRMRTATHFILFEIVSVDGF